MHGLVGRVFQGEAQLNHLIGLLTDQQPGKIFTKLYGLDCPALGVYTNSFSVIVKLSYAPPSPFLYPHSQPKLARGRVWEQG